MFNKTVNLVSTKISKMKLADFYTITRNPDDPNSWINSQKHILSILTVGGIAVILLWQKLDKYYVETIDFRLPWLRWITIAVFCVNLFLGLYRKGERAIKQHLVAGFYMGTVFCTLLSMFTGASQSPYWFGLFFIIVAWFVMVPFNFREMVIHSFVFVLTFITGQYAQREFLLVPHEMGKIIFLYSVTLSVSFFAAFIRNQLDASNLRIKKQLQEKNLELLETNKELKKFRLALEQAPGAVFIMDKHSRFEYINPFFTHISGYTKNDLLHKNINDTLYKGTGGVPDSRKEIINTLSQGKNWQGELLTRHKNGSHYWANTIAAPVKNEQGETDGFVVIQQDITERMNFEKTIRESEAKYKALVENSQDGIIITQNGKFKFVNHAMCRMLGYTPEELYQMEGTDIIPASDRERINKIHVERMQGKVNSLNYSMQMLTKNNNVIDVELQSSTVEYEGKPAGFMTLHDVTESKRMQRALEESEKKYRELTEMLPQTVYELDRNGDIVYFNETGFKQFGLEKSDLGTSSMRFIAPEQHAKMRANMEKTLTEKRSSSGNKYTAVRKNGETFPAMTFAAPIISGDEVVGIRGLILDMSEHEAMENALRQSEEKYRALIDKATDGIVITQHGRIKFANPSMCAMMQYPMEELLEQPYLNYVMKEDHDVMVNFHKRRMEGEYFTSIYRSRFIPKDGKIITMELNARTSEYNGEPAAFIVIRNITERLKIEQELQHAKTELEKLNRDLEDRVIASSQKLTEANTQLIKLQKENLQSQFEVLRQQVNPHFLFNSLNVLTSLIKLEPDLAEKFTEHLSKVYRYVLENKDNDLVNLYTELDFLDAYIFLLNIRFMDKIEVTVSIPDNKKELLILPLALQLLIENAIKHNSMSKKNPLKIEIFIDDNNILNVVNNLQERESHMASTGVGSKEHCTSISFA